MSGPAIWKPADSLDQLIRQGESVTLENNIKEYGEDIAGLMHLILYGLKGMAAYVDPVSYTHLDVYKRQALPLRNFGYKRSEERRRSNRSS